MGKTNKLSKEYSLNHVKERMLERHGLTITEKEYDAICTKQNIKILSEENGQHVFEAEFKNKNLKFVWCHKRKTVTTVLW